MGHSHLETRFIFWPAHKVSLKLLHVLLWHILRHCQKHCKTSNSTSFCTTLSHLCVMCFCRKPLGCYRCWHSGSSVITQQQIKIRCIRNNLLFPSPRQFELSCRWITVKSYRKSVIWFIHGIYLMGYLFVLYLGFMLTDWPKLDVNPNVTDRQIAQSM